jgi:membrane protein implicated in regulation of membrane protease activity
MKEMGKILIFLGVILMLSGILIYFSSSLFSWFGNLPGDIKVEKPGFKFYFPIVSLLLISAVLNVIIWVFRKIF